jgi:WD40 repeat protein
MLQVRKLAEPKIMFIVEPTLRGGFFDNIMSPDHQMEGNVVAANGEFVAVSFSMHNLDF